MGRVAAEANGRVLDEARFPGRQGRLLFAYLVAARSRPVPRDELADAIWGESPPATWEKALTVIASKLRGLVVEDGITLTTAFGCYRLDLPEGTWVDLFAVESGAQDAEEALAAGELDQARAAAESAESLARRPFLPGEDGAWVEARRRELADVQGRALNVLAEASLRLGDAQDAAKWAEQAIALEPFRETGYRRLMEAHAAAGNRAEALQVYERCRLLLAEELGAYPSPETDSIYRALLEAPQTPVRTTPVAEPTVEPGKSELSQLQTELPALRAKKVTERPSWKRRAVLFSALSGVIAAAVAVPLFAFSSGGSRATQLDGTLGGNAVGAVSASTGHIFAAIPLSASPDAIAAGAGSIWVAMSDRGSRVADRSGHEHGAADDSDTGRTVGAHRGRRVRLGRGHARRHRRADRPARERRPGRRQTDPRRERAVGHRLRSRRRVGGQLGRPDRHPDRSGHRNPGPADLGRRRGGRRGRGRRQRLGDRAVGRGGVLSRIDPAARTVAGTTSVGNEPAAVAVGPDAVWVANGADGTVSKIDPSSGHLEGALPGRQAAERHRRRSGRPRLGCQRRLGDPDRARPRDGPRDPDCPDRRTAQRGRARRRDGVRRGPGAAERAPRRHAHARRREPARHLRAADPDSRSIPPPATRRGSSSR